MLDGYTAERGETRNAAHESLLQKRAELLQAAKNRLCDLVYVYDYDHVNQTVDVVLANDRRAQPIRGIPIAGTGGHGVRNIRAWKGIVQDPDTPDIGVIVYPKLGGGRKFIDFVRRDAQFTYANVQQTAIFFGGIPAALTAGETRIANLVAGMPLLHQLGKTDNGMVAPSGAGFLVKENGDIVIRGNRVFFLGLDQVEADAKAVGRHGDSAGTNISASTVKVYSG